MQLMYVAPVSCTAMCYVFPPFFFFFFFFCFLFRSSSLRM